MALVAGAVVPPEALAAPAQAPAGAPAGTQRILVKLKAPATADQQRAMVQRNGGTLVSFIPQLQMVVVALPAAEADNSLRRYQNDAAVARAEKELARKAAGVPSDPAYAGQWALPQIGWDTARDTITPAGSATIAVLDTGVDVAAAELTGRTVGGWSAFGTQPTSDPHGHGTWLASIAAAETDNAAGIAGVAYAGSRVMPVQVLAADGTGQDGDVIAGVVAAADAGADVILMGFSNPGFSQSLQDAVDYAWGKGAVLVAATGNDASSDPTYPAGDAKVVGVSATDQADALWSGSNSGASAFLGAPGVGVLANALGGGTRSVTGTSASAAVVAGAAALLAANDPNASPGTIVGRLARNADPAGTAAQTGNGRVNILRALGDSSVDQVVPAGAAPLGSGGPFVGPYTAAATAANGAGTMSVNPTTGTAGTAATYTFAFTAAGDFASGSSLTITVPAQWTNPTTNAGAGNVSLSVPNNNACTDLSIASTNGRVIAVNMTCADKQKFEVNYSAASTTTPGAHEFTTRTKSGSGGTLTAIASQPVVTIIGPASKLAFTQQPSGTAQAGTSFASQPKVTVQDSAGQTVMSDSATNVTLSITPGTGTAGAVLNCTTNPVKVTSGVATFSGCDIDKIGTGYTLTATSVPAVTAAVSSAISVTAGSPTKLAVLSVNGGTNPQAGVGFSVVVQAQDAAGNPANLTSDRNITLARQAGTGTLGGTLTLSMPSGQNQVTFTGITYSKAEAGVVLRASAQSNALTADDSAAFTVDPAAAAKLAITSVNGGASPSAVSPFSVVVQSQDGAGNASPTQSATDVELSLKTGTGTLGGTLTGTIPAGSSSVTITGVSYPKAESGVALTATRTAGDALTSADSATFTVVPGSFTKLQILVPGETAAPGTASGKTGAPIDQAPGTSFNVTVNAVDANWNRVSSGNTISISSTDTTATLPINAALSSGTRLFAVTFGTGGTWTVTATNVTDATKTPATSAPILTPNPAPTITSTSRTSQAIGGSGFTLTVTGTGFVSSSVVRFAGESRPTTFVNATQLTAAIPASDLTAAGQFDIHVFNPAPGGGLSNAYPFTVFDCSTNIICIDGNMADWAALTKTPSYGDNFSDAGGGSTDIRAIRLTAGDGNLYARWDVQLPSNLSRVASDGFSVAIDANRDGTPDSRGWVLFNSQGAATVQVERPFGTFVTIGLAQQSCNFSPCSMGGGVSIEASFPLSAFNATGAVVGVQTETRASSSTSSAVKDCVPGGIACSGYFNLDTDTGVVTVTTGHVTTTTINCPDTTRTVNQTTSTCTVTVRDTGKDTSNNNVTVARPTGTVNFSISGGSGTFAPVACTLTPAMATTDSSTCTLTYTPTTVGTGTHTLTASYAGDTSPVIFASSSGTDSLSVTPSERATTTSVGAASATYGDSTVTLAATVSAGTDPATTGSVTFTVLSGSTVIGTATPGSVSATGTASVSYALPAGLAAGSYTISGSYGGGTGFLSSSGTGTLTIGARAITVTADAKSKTYGEADPALTYQVSGSLLQGDGFTGTLSRVAGESVNGGPYAITKGTLGLSSNYTLTYVGANLTITKAALTVTADATPATATTDNFTKTYGSPNPTFTVRYDGFVNGDGPASLGGTLAFATTATTASPVGSYPVTPSGLTSSNYTIAFVGNDLNITTRAITVTADPKSKVYGDADPALTYKVTTGTLVNGDSFAGALTRAPGESVAGGPYAITKGTLALSSNYTLTYVGANLTINKATLTVTANPATRQYSDPNPSQLTATLSGFKNGEDLTTSGVFGTASCTTTATKTTTGSAPITCTQGSLTASNYQFTFVPASLTITKESMTLEYDGQVFVNTTAIGGTATAKLSVLLKEDPDPSLGSPWSGLGLKVNLKVYTADPNVPAASCLATTVTQSTAQVSAGLGSATCDVTGLKENVYTVQAELVDNVAYEAQAINAALNVADPGTGFTTGGGWIDDPNTGTRSNFGYTARFLKNGAVQGNSLFIYRTREDLGGGKATYTKTTTTGKTTTTTTVNAPDGVRDYNFIVKSNSMATLHQKCSTTNGDRPCWATIVGGSNVKAVDRLTGIEYTLSAGAIGNQQQFQLDVTDNGEPGSSSGTTPDGYAIKVWTTTGAFYQVGTERTNMAATNAIPDGTQVPLKGGNVQVRLTK